MTVFRNNNILRYLSRFFGDMRCLAVLVVLTLLVPNVVLCFTEHLQPAASMANILVPAGFFMMLVAASRRTGVTALLSLPFMIFAAFQIVLLYLYGNSVIAVDMFLNVVTTNVSEATELLANLLMAMTIVCLLYLPPLIWGIWAAIRRREITAAFRKKMLVGGLITALAGGCAAGVAYLIQPHYDFGRQTFPVNAVENLVEACHRYSETSRHEELSRGFSYGAEAADTTGEPEIYMLVIGETARGDNWQLGGYERATNPRLSRENGVVFFPKSVSESNTTHKSVPMLMSFACAENFDSITYYKSMITAFREAGFATAFVSNQERNRSYTEHFGLEADTVVYTIDAGQTAHPLDHEVLPVVDRLLADTTSHRKFIVIHTYGSHFKYYDRYPREFAHFLPDATADASKSTRQQLINSYDNTILYTDDVLSELINRLKATGARAALLYASDHGEDIFDDSRERFLHASPVPTYWQIHQSTLAWLSPKLTQQQPEMAKNLEANGGKRISPQKSLFPTMMQLARIKSRYVTDSLSLVSERYSPAPIVYLNDLNEALPIDSCGLTPADMENLRRLLGIR